MHVLNQWPQVAMNDQLSPYGSGGVRLISYCPLCHTQYRIHEATVLEEHEDTHLMHVVCRRCSSSILILMLTGELGVSSVGLVTDLTGDDVIQLKSQERLTADDVLEIHVLLQESPDALLV